MNEETKALDLNDLSELFVNSNDHHEANQESVSTELWRDYVIQHVDLHQHVRKDLLIALLALDINMLLDDRLLRVYTESMRNSIISCWIAQERADEYDRSIFESKIGMVDPTSVERSLLWQIELEYEAFCSIFGVQEDRSYSMIAMINMIVKNDKSELRYELLTDY